MKRQIMPVAIFRVKDKSMKPSINDGDYVIASRVSYIFAKPKAGDIVVLRHPSGRFFIVKRIARITGKGYFVVGDNKPVSEDSRKFGAVGRDSIVGKVFMVIRE